MLQVNNCAATVHSGQASQNASKPPSGDGWELVAAAQRGDRDAFGQLYQRYVGEVSRFVLSRTGDRPLAEDLTSETFLRALRRIDSVSDQGRDVGAWFTTIARNLTVDHVKSSRYRLERTTADLPERSPVSRSDDRGPEQAVIEKETAAELRRHVAHLPSDQQECIRLRFGQGLSSAETAAAMGRTDSAVRALRHRAIGGLRASLAHNAGPVPPPRDTTDPLRRARHAVVEVQQRVAAEGRKVAEQERAQQLAGWHADGQTTAREDDRGAPALAAGGRA